MDFDQLRELHSKNRPTNATTLLKEGIPIFINVLTQKNWEKVRGIATFLFIISFFLFSLMIFSGLYPPTRLHCQQQLQYWKPVFLHHLSPLVNICVLAMAVVSVTFNQIFSQMLSVGSQARSSGGQSPSSRTSVLLSGLDILPYIFFVSHLLGLMAMWLLLVRSKNDFSGRILAVGGVILYFLPSFADVVLYYADNRKAEKLIQDNKNMILVHSVFCAISFSFPIIRQEFSIIKRSMERSAIDVMQQRTKEIIELRQRRAPILHNKTQ